MLISCGISLAAIGLVLRLPDRFTSEATLVVVQQQVSQRYVEPSTNVTVPEAVQAMGRQILSRSRLMGIIDELGLYSNARSRLTQEQLVAVMRSDVSVEPIDESRGNFSAFRISFTTGSAKTAQAVTGRLTTLFIEEQSKTRSNQAEITTKFLNEQLEVAKQRLNALDERSRVFKTEYLGELPERQSVNFAMLSEIRSQLQTVMMGLSRAQQQRLTLQTSIGEKLTRLQSEKAKLLTRYTPRYSDVVAKDQEIAKVTALLERLKTRTPAGDKALDGPVDDPALGSLLSQVQANEVETEHLLKEERRLKAEAGEYQRGLNLAPVREQQLGGILRDHDLYAQNVRELQSRLLQAQQASRVEEQQEGQKFRLVDPPTLPVVPSSPKRLIISLGGIGASLVIGLAIAFLIDTRDRSFHSERELSQPFPVPLLLSVPVLLTPAEERGLKWRRAFEWLAGCAMMLSVLAAEFYVYHSG